MALAIAGGLLAGLVGFLPLAFGLRWTKKTVADGLAGSMVKLFIMIIVSLLLVFMLAIFFIAFDRPHALPFVIAEVVALSAAAIIYGFSRNSGK